MDTLCTKEVLVDYFTPEKKEAFWRTNTDCYKPFSMDKPRVPFTLVFVEDWVKGQMEVEDNLRYYTDFSYQHSIRERCSLQTKKTIGLPLNEAINLGSTIFASIFGGRILYPENSSPWIEPVIKAPSDVKALLDITRKNNVLDCGQLSQWVDAYRVLLSLDEARSEIKFGTCFHGLATIGCMLAGATDFLYMLLDYPEQTELLVKIIVDVGIKFMDEMRALTGDSKTGLILANDDLGILSPGLYEKFCLAAELQLFGYYCSSPSDMRGYHSDSSCEHLFNLLRELKLTDINLSPQSPVEYLRKEFSDSIIHGQIPPLFFRNASIAGVVDCVRKTIDSAGSDGGLVVSVVGCLNEGTPVDNILAAMWAVEQYGSYSHKNLAEDMSNCHHPGRLEKGMPMILEVE